MPEGCTVHLSAAASHGQLVMAEAAHGKAGAAASVAAGPAQQQLPQLNGATRQASGEIGELGDELPSLRSQSSTKSILKQSSEDLDGKEARVKRAVSWHDFEGKDLHTVREFTPSEHDDDELLYNPGEPKACCVIC